MNENRTHVIRFEFKDFLKGALPSQRCDLLVNLRSRGCGPEFTEQNDVKVEVNATISSTQVTPKDISITLRPGTNASFIVAVNQLERYPVDLYYLVDVSASMQENLDHLKTVGVALSLRMMERSSDLWLGFGSFVDKPVSPYINVHPSKINNPCSDYEIRCRPAHGFHHVLSMTGNMSEFSHVIKRQRISGNMDTPEGGLDAMMQAAVCQKAVGWRPEAKHLLLLMTDQPSHLALDSRLAGIVVPHDGLCHLENNVYTGSTRMDHPSVGQLSEKLLENHIYSIFAVEKQQYHWYEELVELLSGSYLGKLGLFQAPNLIGLVLDAYKVCVIHPCVFFWALLTESYSFIGHKRLLETGLLFVFFSQVYFSITIGLRSCPEDVESEDITVMVRPIGYNESTVVRIRSKCQCRCGLTGRCQDDKESSCAGSQTSTNQRSDHGLTVDSKAEAQNHQNCRAAESDVDCSGRGVCDCGKCLCEESRLGTIYGTYCEIDDFSCPYEGGILCGSRGVCVSGECVCQDGWTGDSCSCSISTPSCQSPDGLICSGRGRCVCGQCVCDDPRHSGDFCERCPTCVSNCQPHWKCVDCHITHGLTQKEVGRCNHTCAPLVDYTDDASGINLC
uniref:Integrin beta n=1 Tax=Gouania willdenowi TaxID=441366 RepID=A0A8C5HNF2_GOUWI